MDKNFKKSLSLEQKQTILNEVDECLRKKSEIAKSHGIPRSTLSTILKNRSKIEAAYKTNHFEPQRKRMRSAKNEDVEIPLIRWINEARSQNMTLTGGIIQEKARFFANVLRVEDFKGSSGWLQRFKDRYGICKNACREEGSVSSVTTDTFFRDQLQSVFKDYKPCDIYNADETGLFWKAFPDRTLCVKGQNCFGENSSKMRLTIMIACNMDGSDKLPLLVIGKSAKPQCFDSVKTLPVPYDANVKAWMTPTIFAKWLKELDNKFHREKRTVCIIIDNCSAHCEVSGLKAIKLVFLPPSITSKLQPCGQGIIQCLKLHYRKEMIQRAIDCFDKKIPFDVNLLDALTILRSAWRTVNQTTIQNCFCHAGFVVPASGQAINYDAKSFDDESKEILTIVENAQERGVFPNSITFEEYVLMDNDVLTSETLNEEEKKSENSDSDDDEEANVASSSEASVSPNNVPSLSEASVALDTVRRFLLSNENSFICLNSVDDIEDFLRKCRKKTNKQSSISDYFR